MTSYWVGTRFTLIASGASRLPSSIGPVPAIEHGPGGIFRADRE
jgi:hypothetical protein